MKARLVLDQDCDLSQRTADQPDVAFVPGKNGKLKAIYPKGSEFSGPQALLLCRTGQATPSDDECAAALGLSDAQLKSLQLSYEMDSKGINDKQDRELYRAGVILGYDEQLNYIPGPQWAAYQAALQELDEDDIDGDGH